MRDKSFFLLEIPILLTHLQEDTNPSWGSMTPQQMIEHVIGSWRISNGKAAARIVIAEEKISRNQRFLFSDSLFIQNIPNPIFKNGLPPLRKENLQAAKNQLIQEIQDFFSYFEKNPKGKHIHPVFGELDYKGWLQFQSKHVIHHFKQFGLV